MLLKYDLFKNIYQSLNNKKVNVFALKCHYAWTVGMSVAFLLSRFDVSLFVKRINMTVRICNAL